MTPVLGSLTCREEAVLLLLAEGFGLREAAARLGLSELQARRSRDTARRRLGAATIAQAVYILATASRQ